VHQQDTYPSNEKGQLKYVQHPAPFSKNNIFDASVYSIQGVETGEWRQLRHDSKYNFGLIWRISGFAVDLLVYDRNRRRYAEDKLPRNDFEPRLETH